MPKATDKTKAEWGNDLKQAFRGDKWSTPVGEIDDKGKFVAKPKFDTITKPNA